MKLIVEKINNAKFLTEEKNGKRDYFIEGIFLQGNLTNRNGRVYPMETLKKSVNKYITEYVNQKRAFGELCHPDSPTINLDRVSHMIESLRCEGNNYVGKAKIVDTPMGRIVKSLIDAGATLGVSSRAVGTIVESDGVGVVQDDLILATAADIVADPSAPEAFVEGIMEGKEWVWENGILKEARVADYKKKIQMTDAKKLNEAKFEVFAKFIEDLGKHK